MTGAQAAAVAVVEVAPEAAGSVVAGRPSASEPRQPWGSAAAFPWAARSLPCAAPGYGWQPTADYAPPAVAPPVAPRPDDALAGLLAAGPPHAAGGPAVAP